MKCVLVMAGILATTLSALGQPVDQESYIGDIRKATVSTRASAGFLMPQVGTPTRLLVADLATFNPIGATNSTHFDSPHAVFENQIGAPPPYMRMGSSKFQIRHTRRRKRRHYRKP
jgi:hypothetical protein